MGGPLIDDGYYDMSKVMQALVDVEFDGIVIPDHVPNVGTFGGGQGRGSGPNGEPPPFLSWEDTVDVPARGRVRIAWIADDRPGSWMFHCHILEHHAAGMMAHFDVVH